jgi:hypothetical protein
MKNVENTLDTNAKIFQDADIIIVSFLCVVCFGGNLHMLARCVQQNTKKTKDNKFPVQSHFPSMQLTAGIITAPSRIMTKEGLEEDMAVSYLSRLAIVRRLAAWKEQGKAKAAQKVWVMGFPGTCTRLTSNSFEVSLSVTK